MTRTALWLCLASVAMSIGLRALYLTDRSRVDVTLPPTFLAAEALVGLMGRHILEGARPVFYYGQAYLGTFEAYLAAALFSMFGDSLTTLRLIPTAFALSWIPLSGAIAARLWGRRAAYLAAALVALPSQFAFEWGLVAWGGHANVAMILLTLYCCLLALERLDARRLAALGFVAGFSLWVNQLTLAYVPVYGALVAWLRLRRKQLILLLVAGLVGSAPLLYGNVLQPLGTVRNLAYEVVLSWRHRQRLAQRMEKVPRFYRSVPLFQVLGVQPRRDGRWSIRGTVSAAVLALGGLAAAWGAYRTRRERRVRYRGSALLVACAGVSVLVGFAGFFGQPVGRYNLPLYPILCVLAAGWLHQARAGIVIAALLVLGNAVQLASPTPSDGRTPTTAVVHALLERGLHYGYGADNMYDLIFESGEEIVIEPVEWSRYGPYRSMVAAADRIFYLYRSDQQGKISHQVFVAHVAAAGVQYRRFDVGEYHVMYDLTPRDRISAQAIVEMRRQILTRKKKGGAPRAQAQ